MNNSQAKHDKHEKLAAVFPQCCKFKNKICCYAENDKQRPSQLKKDEKCRYSKMNHNSIITGYKENK